jgi:hypothetical protein
MEGQRRLLVSLLTSTLGGAIGWFVYLQVLQFTASAVFSPMIETERVRSIFVQVSVTAVVIFAALGILTTALSHLRWWMNWLAFVAGIVICIVMRFHPEGIELTIEVLLRTAVVSASLSSGIAAYLFSQFHERRGSAGS